jgi:competence protein ComEC
LKETTRFNNITSKTSVDLLLLSGNPKLYLNQLSEIFTIKQVVFDGSCPAWKVNYWKKDCASLQIPYHDVSEKGAFVMKMN